MFQLASIAPSTAPSARARLLAALTVTALTVGPACGTGAVPPDADSPTNPVAPGATNPVTAPAETAPRPIPLGGWTAAVQLEDGNIEMHACFWEGGRLGTGDFEYNLVRDDMTWTADGKLVEGGSVTGAWYFQDDNLVLQWNGSGDAQRGETDPAAGSDQDALLTRLVLHRNPALDCDVPASNRP